MVAGAPGVAHADPPGPTDYRTTIVSVTPETDAIELVIEGGDSFVTIAVEPGHEAMILGYADEPYVRILTDGTVEQNRRSYATYYNEERYGRLDVPDIVDNDAAPEWEVVGTGGTWAWHDHRAHWMSPDPPIGLEPGESLPSQFVPLVVDGTPVTVEVRITLQDEPSLAPVVAGLVLGAGLALLGVLLGPASTATAMLLVSIGSLVVGAAQFWSVPASTGRPPSWWLLPAMGVVALMVAIATYGRSRLALHGLTLLAALQVGLWAIRRRSGLTSAVLPTDLTAGFDRFVTAVAITASVVVTVAALRALLAPGPAATSER